MQGLKAPEPGHVEIHRDLLWVETPEGPRVVLMFDNERAMRAVVSFLRDTKVGQTVTIHPRGAAGGATVGMSLRRL